MRVPWYLMAKGKGGGGSKSASGPVVTFRGDGSPLRSLLVNIDPVQDLHGYDNPWPAGGGKNLLENTAISQTINGVTFTVNSDGTVNVNGTATADISFVIGEWIADGSTVKGSGCQTGGSTSTYRQFFTYIGSDIGDETRTVEPNAGSRCECTIRIYTNFTANNLLFKPMIRLASVSDATYAPYSNICPISGWTEANVWVKPTYDPTASPTATLQLGQTVYGGTLDVTNGVLTVTHKYATYNGTENWSLSNSNEYLMVWNQTPAISNNDLTQIANWLVGGGYGYGYFGKYRAQSNGAICVGNVIDSNNSVYKWASASEFKAYLADNPLSVCYELATPITYQLTPQEVMALKGANNIWADTGDVTAEYDEAGGDPALLPLAVAFMGEE